MIAKNIKRFCKDFTKIENYEKAVNSKEKWDCHHRLETHNSEGERRLVDLSREELKALDMYFDRPAEELIFLSHKEHTRLHHKDKVISEKARKKMSEVMKGGNNGSFKKGHIVSNEIRKKISESNKRKKPWNKGKKCTPFSEETKKKKSEAMKGKHWKLIDGRRIYY